MKKTPLALLLADIYIAQVIAYKPDRTEKNTPIAEQKTARQAALEAKCQEIRAAPTGA